MKWVNDNDKMGGEINFLIPTPSLDDLDQKIIKEIIFVGEPFNTVEQGTTMIDLLVLSKIFSSKNEARRNWKGDLEILNGFTEFRKLGKLNRSIFIHKIPKDYLPK